ncbi:MAG TPA: metallophosphoesterase [Candidatus Eisenbacteria bacterium]
MTNLFFPAVLLATLHLFLIGDAGKPRPGGEPVLEALRHELERDPAASAVVFLGDNIYESGLPEPSDPDYDEMARRIGDQVRTVTELGVRGLFLPGNHDWAGKGQEEWKRVQRQEALVESLGTEFVRWLPDRGCPGPEVIDDWNPGLRLIVLDTQWWLQGNDRPEDAGICPAPNDTAVVAALSNALATAGERRVIVVAHHPLATRGAHGGHFTVLDHLVPLRNLRPWLLIPLPVIGSLYPFGRAHGVYRQDLSASRNKYMRAHLMEAFRSRPPWMYVAGHEHNLQLLDGKAELGPGAPAHLVVSGAGVAGHTEPVDRDRTRVASSKAGFFRLDFNDDGTASLTMFTVSKDGVASEAWRGPVE